MHELLAKTLMQVLVTFTHTWPYLLLSVLVAATLKVHVEPARLRAWLARHQRASVVGAIGLAVLTPLCSCGTMALVLAMLVTAMPWAPCSNPKAGSRIRCGWPGQRSRRSPAAAARSWRSTRRRRASRGRDSES